MSGFSLCIYILDYQGQTVSYEDLAFVPDWNPTCVDAYAILASSNTIVHTVLLRHSQYFGFMKMLHWIPGRFQAIMDSLPTVPQAGMVLAISRSPSLHVALQETLFK